MHLYINCRIKNKYPLNGKRCNEGLVDCAEVESSYGNAMTYIGCAEGHFFKKDVTTMAPLSEYKNVDFV